MNIGELIDHYQEWVDYDMKRYGKISDETNRDIEEAGLQIVKDKYGDYEVITGKYNESLKSENSWIKRWNFLDNYYKGDLVISKISSPCEAWHIEKVDPNGHTIKHLGNYKSLKVAMDAAEQYLIKNESKSIENNVVPDESLKESVNYDYPKYSKTLYLPSSRQGKVKLTIGTFNDPHYNDEHMFEILVVVDVESRRTDFTLDSEKLYKELNISDSHEKLSGYDDRYDSIEDTVDEIYEYFMTLDQDDIDGTLIELTDDFDVNRVKQMFGPIDESLEASKSRTFIELPEFQKLWQKFNLTDDDLMSLQNQIINGNQAVSLGSNVYKIRFSPKQISKGKDTTDRVIYIDYIIDSKVYLVTIFSKSDESNLTKDELNNIRKLSKSLEVK